jgi:hypothetical protein
LRTGIAESALRRATFVGENWIARFAPPPRQGAKPAVQHPLRFARQRRPRRNSCRRRAHLRQDRFGRDERGAAEDHSLQRQGDLRPAGRAANGLNVGLRHQLGIARKIVSACHSISIGFDVVPAGRDSFDFPAVTYFSERPSDRIPYLTLFPIGTRMRANLFAYRGFDDLWLRELRRPPAETLNAAATAQAHHRPIRHSR